MIPDTKQLPIQHSGRSTGKSIQTFIAAFPTFDFKDVFIDEVATIDKETWSRVAKTLEVKG